MSRFLHSRYNSAFTCLGKSKFSPSSCGKYTQICKFDISSAGSVVQGVAGNGTKGMISTRLSRTNIRRKVASY